MVWTIRALFLLAFALFWGGLTFYTGFVVRISHDVLEDTMSGGLITQRTTTILQTLGLITVVLMFVNGVSVARQSPRFGYALVIIGLLLGATLIGLFIVHGLLDDVIDVDAFEVTDYDSFRAGHRRYNQLTTVEWTLGLVYLLVTVRGWQLVDRLPRAE